MASIRDEPDTTCDRFLGGRIAVEQMKSGAHRAGLDAVLLAAALPQGATGELTDLGAGVGVAGLAACALNSGLSLTLVDNNSDALRLAHRNAARAAEWIGDAAAVRIVEADITQTGPERRRAGLVPQSADFVISNPPYNEAASTRASPHRDKAHAHVLSDSDLRAWIRTAIWLLRPKGEVLLIVRTSRLPLALDAFGAGLGGISILPVQARAKQAAMRVLIKGARGSRAPLRILPGLVMHGPAGSQFRPECAAIFAGNERILW